MPYSIEIRARTSVDVGRHISFRDMHRLACYLAEPASKSAHELQVKPFAIWPLMTEGEHFIIRLAVLIDDVAMVRRISGRLKATPHLGEDIPLAIEGCTIDTQSFEDLSRSIPRSQILVDCVSPVVYSRNGKYYALPDPHLVHRGLVMRWNEFAPKQSHVTDDDARQLLSTVEMIGCKIEAANVKDMGRRIGFTGSVKYKVSSDSNEDVQRWFTALWRFASFSGLGSMTTHGLGAVNINI